MLEETSKRGRLLRKSQMICSGPTCWAAQSDLTNLGLITIEHNGDHHEVTFVVTDKGRKFVNLMAEIRKLDEPNKKLDVN